MRLLSVKATLPTVLLPISVILASVLLMHNQHYKSVLIDRSNSVSGYKRVGSIAYYVTGEQLASHLFLAESEHFVFYFVSSVL